MIQENFENIKNQFLPFLFFMVTNKVLVLGLVTQVTSMFVKAIIKSIKNKKFSLKNMADYGGMPSSHTAFIISVALGIGIEAEVGWFHPSYAFVIIMVFIVLVDAIKLRGNIDSLNRVLSNIIDENPSLKEKITLPKQIAHTTPEVIGGIVYAFISTFFFYLFFDSFFPLYPF